MGKLVGAGFNTYAMDDETPVDLTAMLERLGDQIDLTYVVKTGDDILSSEHYKIERLGMPCMQTSGRKTTFFAYLKKTMEYPKELRFQFLDGAPRDEEPYVTHFQNEVRRLTQRVKELEDAH